MATRQRPYFIWDYDLTEDDLRAILRGDDATQKAWVMARLLESARYEDVWRYITLAELRTIFPQLQLKPRVREAWALALNVWAEDSPRGR